MKPLTLHILDWRVTVGLSFLSLAANLGYYALVTHDVRQTMMLAAASLFSIAATHAAHYVAKTQSDKRAARDYEENEEALRIAAAQQRNGADAVQHRALKRVRNKSTLDKVWKR